MARDFYPFVEKNSAEGDAQPSDCNEALTVHYPARIALYDDISAAPRVVVIEPDEPRAFLESITEAVARLSKEQGGTIPFMVIREIVENFIHAYFIAPTITILDNGNTIRFSDQGPGIQEKHAALQFGTTSASEEMKQYIRGVGSGLPYVQHYMEDKGGSLTIEDNIAGGTVVTLSIVPSEKTAEGMSPIPAGMPGQVGFRADYQQTGAGAYGVGTYAQPGIAGMPAVPGMPGAPGGGTYQQPWVPQVYQQQQGIPQPYQPSPMQQSAYQPYPPQFVQQPSPAVPATPPLVLSERQQQILSLFVMQSQVGPTDLVQHFGLSSATWSREITTLVKMGILQKGSQKFIPTMLGQNYIH